MQPLVAEQGEEGGLVAVGATQAGARTHDPHLQRFKRQTFIIIAYFCFNALWKTKVTLHAFVYVLRAAAQRIESCIFISDEIKVSGLEFRETWT